MERAEIAETITELMEDVFDVDDLVYSDDLDASQVEEWDRRCDPLGAFADSFQR